MKQLIIAEKPKLATNVTLALKEQFDKKEGYYESENFIVTYALGHLFELYSIEDYLGIEKPKWSMDILPFTPENHHFKFKLKDDDKVKKQYSIIKNLVTRSDVDEIYNCGDSDNEGEILIRILIENIFWESKINKPIKRIWSPEQTPNELYKAYKNAKSSINYNNIANEGFARTYLDWELGINLTRLLTLATNSKKALNVGRVLVPIVKEIYDRDMAIKNFKSEPYYQLESKEETNGYEIALTIPKKYSQYEYEEAKAISDLINCEKAFVTNIETKEVTKKPLQLFSLSKLQEYISSKLKISFNDIYVVIQSLYEKGYITYPRTNSCYLGEDEKGKAMKLIELFNEEGYELEMKDTKSIFDSSQIESHSAIIPTLKIPTDLKGLDKDVYETIKTRFICNFLKEKCLIDRTTITIKVDDKEFNIKGDMVKQLGFTKYEPQKKAKDVTELPLLKVGDEVNIKFVPIKKMTKAPSKYTTKALSEYLKNPFKDLKEDSEDQLEKTILDGAEIGTEATRTGIIEKAKTLGYIKEEKTVLSIEPKGIFIIEVLNDLNINLFKEKTIEMGKKLKQVSSSILTLDDLLIYTKKELREIFENSKEIEVKQMDNSDTREVIGICPWCGKNVYEGEKNFYCEGYKDEPKCQFTIWKNDKFFELKGKKVTKTIARSLLKNDATTVKGLKGKKGDYNAKIKLIRKDINGRSYANFEIVGFV